MQSSMMVVARDIAVTPRKRRSRPKTRKKWLRFLLAVAQIVARLLDFLGFSKKEEEFRYTY